MLYYFRRYPLSLVIMAVIFYLSFFTPPKSNLEEIPNIDKLVHVCMYGGLCSILWFEYLRTHRMIIWRSLVQAQAGPQTKRLIPNGIQPFLFADPPDITLLLLVDLLLF